ncbi:helix-turn-helix domain-containing protein [candidate division KSB1 bacterium]|nr:helix-turn-helix domain-containing protein [candidate division KSB1 bacterium]
MKKEIGVRFRNIREARNLSQAEMGNSLGIKYQHVSKYERGESVPTWENLIKMVELYNVNLNWLLTGRGKMFLTPLGYVEKEDSTPHRVRDKDTKIEEIVEELKKDSELKVLIYDYVKSYWNVKHAASRLRDQAEYMGKSLKSPDDK